jgi:hypothetical protein
MGTIKDAEKILAIKWLTGSFIELGISDLE